MNILITGGAGFIGSHVLLNLLLNKKGKEFTIIDNFSNSSKEIIRNISKFSDTALNIFELDIRNETKLNKIIKDIKPDVTFHFAGLKSVSDSEKNPILYYDNNVCGTLQLIKALNISNCKMIVFSSSATVYGNPLYLPFDENHETNPINVYGKTKLISENLIESWAKNKSPRLSIALRYFNPIGAHTSGLFGENPSGVPNNLLPYICKVANNEIETLKIFGNDYDTIDGTGVRDYLHVMDIADAHLKCLELFDKRFGFLKLNLGIGYGYSVLDVINCFEKINNIKIPYLITKRREGDLGSYWANSETSKKTLNWSPKFSLKDACKHSWEWYKYKKDNF